MSLVVVHHVRDRRAQRDVVHPEPVDQADERGSLARIVDPDIGRQQVHRLVVELGQEGAARPVGVLLVDVLVAVDAAAKARLGLDDELRLDVVAEHQLRLAVARGPEVVLGDEVELLERLVVRPGPAEPSFILLAELARSGAGRRRLVDVADLRLQLRDAVWRLRDDRQHALVPHDGAHAAAAGPSALVVARPELVFGAERHRRHVAILVVLAGGADRCEVRVGVPIAQPHDLLVAGEPEQIAGGLERNPGTLLAVPDHQVHGHVGPALQNHLVEPGPFELRAELAAPGRPYRGGQALVGDLEWAVGREIRAEPGHDVRRRQHAGVDDQGIVGRERVRDGPLRQDLERSPESSQHILEVPARHVFDADVPGCQVDGRTRVDDCARVATGSVERGAHRDNLSL